MTWRRASETRRERSDGAYVERAVTVRDGRKVTRYRAGWTQADPWLEPVYAGDWRTTARQAKGDLK